MQRRLGQEDFEDLAMRQLLVYKELGEALRTIDATVEPDNLFHPVLQGIMLLPNSKLTPTEQAAVLATTGNQLAFPEIRVALRDQWSHERLMYEVSERARKHPMPAPTHDHDWRAMFDASLAST